MYVLEGNIGVGKSTFLSLIKEYFPAIAVVPEPVDAWHRQQHSQSLLSLFYQDPQRWAYTLETFAAACRVQEHMREQQRTHQFVVERSIYSGHYSFAKNDYLNGYLTDVEWQLYSQWFDFLVNSACKPPLGFIYLQACPEVLVQRIQKRARPGEEMITRTYLEQIDARHYEFLIEKKELPGTLKNIPVLTIDVNEEFEANPQQREVIAHQLSTLFR